MVTSESNVGERRERLGGVWLRVDGRPAFLPASVTVRIAPAPRLARVPGAPNALLGIAIHRGLVVPVIALGDEAGTSMIVCTHLGEHIGLLGAHAVRSGFFDVAADAPGTVLFEGERAATLDLATLYARVEEGTWAGRIPSM